MTDTQKLKGKIDEAGLKLRFVAKKAGITYPSLTRKIHNASQFTAEEIKNVSRVLNLSLPELDAIFFADYVDKTPTKRRP